MSSSIRYILFFLMSASIILASQVPLIRKTEGRRRVVRIPEVKLAQCIKSAGYDDCLDMALRRYHCCHAKNPGDENGECAIQYVGQQDECYEVGGTGCRGKGTKYEACCHELFTRFLPNLMDKPAC